jgi:hypothetical protein
MVMRATTRLLAALLLTSSMVVQVMTDSFLN